MIRRGFILLSVLLITIPALAQVKIVPDGKPEEISLEKQRILRPSWSPDGKWLAFTTANQRGIYLLNLESGEIEELTDKPGAGYHFAWSPDGAYIAYRARYVENRRAKMAVEIIDVANKTVVAQMEPEKRVGLPVWGESNGILFYTLNERLQTLETGLTQTRRIRKSVVPQKERIVFTSFGRLQVAEVERPDSLIQPYRDVQVINEVLSPSRSKIVCEEYGGDLIVIDLETGKRVSLGDGHRPAWSPDEQWVCFMVTRDDGHQYLSSEIAIASSDGKQRFPLTQTKELLEMNPSWSPDGTAIAYDEMNSGVIFIQKLRYEQK